VADIESEINTGSGLTTAQSNQLLALYNTTTAGTGATVFSTDALQNAPSGSGLDAAGVRSAIGLSSANLDTQLADLPTVSEFEARTIPSADYFDPTTDTVTAGTVSDKTGYSLTQAFPTNFEDLAITDTTGFVSVGSLATDSVNANALAADAIAEINATVDTALSDYGAYTGTPPSASDIRTEIDSNSTQLAAILLDTGTTIPSTLSGLLTSTAFTNALPTNFGALGINASGHISRVTLVDTNTDMRGTDSALTTLGSTAPSNWIDANAIAASAITEIQFGLATPGDVPTSDITAIKAKTDQLTFTIANQVDANALSGGGWRRCSCNLQLLHGIQ
jgi:hypothetical protein